MNPSSVTSNFPSRPPFSDLSKSQFIGKVQTCRHCGASIPTVNQICPECGRRDSDLVTWWIVDKRSQNMASPEYSSIEQVQQFAEIFSICPEADYGITECIHLYGSVGRQQERDDHLVLLEWNAKRLDWLKEQKPLCGEDPDALILLAHYADLTGYALPQFRDTTAQRCKS